MMFVVVWCSALWLGCLCLVICHRVECAFISPVRTECGMFVMYCMQCCMSCVSCFVVRGCAVSRRYINVCNCDMFSVVNVYLDHLNFCVVCIKVCLL